MASSPSRVKFITGSEVYVQSRMDVSFAQLCFLDEEEVQTRCKIFPGLKKHVIHDLQEMLYNYNLYLNSLKRAMDFITDSSNREYKIVSNANQRPNTEHERCFNAPE